MEKLSPALHLVKFPVFVSKERSVPSARTFVPTTLERLTTGFAVNPMLELIPAYSCKYWSSIWYAKTENSDFHQHHETF